MKAIAKLKDDARKYEQKEEWEKAIQAYLQVLKLGEQEGGAELDLPLYNRVGDLYVRLGRPSDAVTYYEQAADRYGEAGLFNNAIALCNKALRYDAGRLSLFRKLGSFSASQGFFTDARRWYLEYAEKAIKLGKLDDAISALSDYADVNDDADARELLARKLRDHHRTDRAIIEFKRAYSLRVAAGEKADADRIRKELLAIDPGVDLSDAPQARAQTHTSYADSNELPGFVDLDALPTPAAEEPPTPAPVQAVAEPEPIDIESTAIADTDEDAQATDFGPIDLEAGLGRVDEEDDVTALDIGLEQPPEAPTDSEEIEPAEGGAFELPVFDTGEIEPMDQLLDLPGFDDIERQPELGTELPLLDEEEDAAEDFTPLPGFDGLVTEADLPMVETTDFGSAAEKSAPGSLDSFDAFDAFDMPEMERSETGHAGEPLAPFSFQPDDTAPPAEAVKEPLEQAEFPPFTELPTFDDPDSEFGAYTPERAFEFITPDFENKIESENEIANADEVEAENTDESDRSREDGPADAYDFEAEPWREPESKIERDPWLEPEDEQPAAEPEAEPEPINPAARIEPEFEHDFTPARALSSAPPPAPAQPVQPAPSKPKSDYVDLAALLGADDEEADDSTRFVVAEKPPTGDEEQDFADMLEQFKSKVAASIPTEDAGSHYDLGIAFKEMGLIDEAIGEFQTALRAGQEKLKVYEELGSCFVMKGQFSVAITILNRAQHMPYTDEHELLGVYYNLGRAHEELGQRADAKSAYEKIVAIDIGFQDTTRRLARL